MATLSMSSMTTMTGSGNNNNCVLPILDLQTPSVTLRNEKLRVSSHNQFYSNNTSIGGLSSYNNYFGTGIDGDVTVSSSLQISSSTSPAGLNNTLYGDVIVKNYKSLTINAGVLFTPLNPCRGLIIYCTGNLTVNGTISMTGKGGGVGNKIAAPLGIAPVTEARYDLVDATIYVNNMSSSTYRVGGRGIPTHWNWAPSGSAWFSNYKIRIPLSGSVAGGAGGTPTGNTGTAGVFCCGGGGGGGTGQVQYGQSGAGGAGGRGTIFSGGGGGGGGAGGAFASSAAGVGLFESGGGGGNGPYGKGGGGAGVPSGTNTPGSGVGSTGVGGSIVFIVRGNFTNNGTISANGSNGGNGTGPSYGGGGGGGSGGGCILIIYGGTYLNLGTIVANGGSGGANGAPAGGSGGSGGAGSIRAKKVNI